VGSAVAIRHRASGWIGHVFVSPQMRGRGLATDLTRVALEQLRELGCATILLTATAMGRPVYQRLGFEVETHHHEYRGQGLPARTALAPWRPLLESDLEGLRTLDRKVTGDDRGALLGRFAPYGWGHSSEDGLTGAILPSPSGGGLAALLPGSAESAEATLRAIRTLAGPRDDLLVYPTTENEAAHRLLRQEGFEELRAIPRMVLGQPLQWVPQAVWSPLGLALG
jgi:GNAT superfamily N-acetyltransferase